MPFLVQRMHRLVRKCSFVCIFVYVRWFKLRRGGGHWPVRFLMHKMHSRLVCTCAFVCIFVMCDG